MKTVLRIFISILISLVSHLGVVFLISIYVSPKSSPILYCWTNILDKKDLSNFTTNDTTVDTFLIKKSYTIKKYYFSNVYEQNSIRLSITPTNKLIFLNDRNVRLDVAINSMKDSPIYLWKKEKILSEYPQENVSFKTLVAASGKILFIIPEKLLTDTQQTILLQHYIKESLVFLNNKFFWTKLKTILK